MDEPKRDLVRTWLIKAQRDLAAARKLSAPPDVHLDTAIYHCQQAAEKALKGYLVYRDQRFNRTHDIEVLVGLAQQHEPPFASWLDAADELTTHANAYRYPGDPMEPSEDDFSSALEKAEGIVAFVLSRLPDDAKP